MESKEPCTVNTGVFGARFRLCSLKTVHRTGEHYVKERTVQRLIDRTYVISPDELRNMVWWWLREKKDEPVPERGSDLWVENDATHLTIKWTERHDI